MTSPLDFGKLCRCHVGAFTLPRQELPSDRGDSSASPLFIAIASKLRPVDLALKARSAPAWPCWGSCSSSWRLLLVSAAIAGWKVCLQPRRRPQVWCYAWPFSREHGAAPRRRSHWTVASPPQPWLRRWCRRHGLPSSFSASSPVSSTPSPSVSVFMSWWPGQRARHACLLLLCLC
jgi:hypothetical protein